MNGNELWKLISEIKINGNELRKLILQIKKQTVRVEVKNV